MAQFFSVHPEQPQPRLIKQAAEIMRKGGLIAFPTDSAYALGGITGDNALLARIRRIRGVDERHHFTLICRDLSDIKLYEFFQTIGTIPTMFFCLLSEIIQYVFPETHACRTIITHLTQSENILFPDHPEFFFCVFSNLLFAIQQELIDHDILR